VGAQPLPVGAVLTVLGNLVADIALTIADPHPAELSNRLGN
jgi:hypothetical protein